ncbi:MAG: MvaI/BcnI family restriction endonuclease [Bacteroidota bacterium]|nr:MvaI/BcnI family restriction endonuclease [Bacteroidota bacterium]
MKRTLKGITNDRNTIKISNGTRKAMTKHKQLTIATFKKKFARVREKGWIASKRKGPTGVGQTLEYYLGMKENNIALPDLGTVELKAHHVGSSSMITLFTFNRKACLQTCPPNKFFGRRDGSFSRQAWKINPLQAIRKYGTRDSNGRLGMYFTMARTPNSMGLFLHIDKSTIDVRHVSGEVIAEWQLDVLAERFAKKIPGLVLVSAFSEMRGDAEWFKYDRAQLLTGTSPNIIHNQISAGNILVDLRLHDKGTSARNHGTGFRTHEDKLTSLFNDISELT